MEYYPISASERVREFRVGRPKSKIAKPKRARGGQPGNRNRLKHGFYSRAERSGRIHARQLEADVAMVLATLADPVDRQAGGGGRGASFPV